MKESPDIDGLPEFFTEPPHWQPSTTEARQMRRDLRLAPSPIEAQRGRRILIRSMAGVAFIQICTITALLVLMKQADIPIKAVPDITRPIVFLDVAIPVKEGENKTPAGNTTPAKSPEPAAHVGTPPEEPRKTVKNRRRTTKKPSPITSSPSQPVSEPAPSTGGREDPARPTVTGAVLADGGNLGPSPGGETETTVDREELLRAYRAKIHRLMRQNHRYPPMALRAKLEGVVIVQILIDRSGNILEVTIKNSSGLSLLDRAALRTVKNIARVPVPPAALGWGKQFLEVPFVYRLRDEKKKYHSRNPEKGSLPILGRDRRENQEHFQTYMKIM